VQLITPTGEIHPLNSGINTIGRVPGNDVVLLEGAMSRRHAEVRWDGQHCIVVDLWSTNGTFLNGRRLAPNQPQLVAAGDRLGFGPNMVVTLMSDSLDAAATRVAPGPAPASRSAAGPSLMFRAMDAALDYRKLGVLLLGLLVAGLVGAAFFWIFAEALAESAVVGAAVGVVGSIALWLILTFTTAAVTRLLILELNSGERGAIREALAFAGRHLLAFLFSPLLLILGLVLIIVGESIFLLVGRIDYLGELVVSLAFLPLVILNMLVILTAWFGAALTFPIIADRGAGVGATLSHVLALVRRAPGRLMAYMILAGVISLITFVVLLYLLFSALSITFSLAAIGMEPFKFGSVFSGLPMELDGLLPGLFNGGFGRSFWLEAPPTYDVARFVFSLSLLVLGMLVLTVPQAFYLTSTCAVYLTLRRDVPISGDRQGRGQGDKAYQAQRRSAPAGQREFARDSKACRYCGAPLAYDQTYCPHCGKLQR